MSTTSITPYKLELGEAALAVTALRDYATAYEKMHRDPDARPSVRAICGAEADRALEVAIAIESHFNAKPGRL